VNSFEALDAAEELAAPAELAASLAPPPPTDAAFALGAPCPEGEDVEDVVPAKARSGPNSRLALAAGVRACADVAADATPDRPDGAPSAGVTPDISLVS